MGCTCNNNGTTMPRCRRSRCMWFVGIGTTFLLLSSSSLLVVQAFSGPIRSPTITTTTTTPLSSSTQLRLAKPAPSSLFNLDEIEAVEARILQQEAEEAAAAAAQAATLWNTVDNDNDATNDWDDDDDDDEASSTVVEIPAKVDGKRLDAALAVLLDQSRSWCGTLVGQKRVSLITSNNVADSTVVTRKSAVVETGQVWRIDFSAGQEQQRERPTRVIPQAIPLEILYEDDHLLVLNKAADMVVHPAPGNWEGTVVNAVAHHVQQEQHRQQQQQVSDDLIQFDAACSHPTDSVRTAAAALRPGVVHRLDKGTTGVLVVAKTTTALANLSQAFAERRVRKTYLAIAVGNPGHNVCIDKPIGRHPVHRQKMRVVPNPHANSQSLSTQRLYTPTKTVVGGPGKRAISHVDTLAFDGKLSLVQIRIETGRTHQIRVHLQDRHTPVYGDDVYGVRLSANHGVPRKGRHQSANNKNNSNSKAPTRPLLHAHRLQLEHPISGQPLDFIAPLPLDMQEWVHKIDPTLAQQEQPQLFGL